MYLKLFTRSRAFHVPAEPISELVCSNHDGSISLIPRVELVGLEPTPSSLPATRSSQLSYSPSELKSSGFVDECSLSIPRRC